MSDQASGPGHRANRWILEWPAAVVFGLIWCWLAFGLVQGVQDYRFGQSHPRALATVLAYEFRWQHYRSIDLRFQPGSGPVQRALVPARYEFPPRVLPDPGGSIEIAYAVDDPADARLPGYREAVIAAVAWAIWSGICWFGWRTVRERRRRPPSTGGRHRAEPDDPDDDPDR